MFIKKNFVYSIVFIFFSYLGYVFYNLLYPRMPISLVPEKTWWSDSVVKNKVDDPNLYPFEIKVSEQVSLNFMEKFYIYTT